MAYKYRMRFAERLKQAKGLDTRKRLLVCLAGLPDDWLDFSPWWTDLEDTYRVTAIAHAWAKPNVDPALFAQLRVDPGCDALGMIERLIEPKCVNWEKPSPPVCDRDGATRAYGLLKVGHMKRMLELESKQDFDMIVFAQPNVSIQLPEVDLEPRTVYSKITPWNGSWTSEMDTTFFYSDSGTFNGTCGFFRHLPVIKPYMFKLDVRGVSGPKPEKIPLGMPLYYHHMMLRTRVRDSHV